MALNLIGSKKRVQCISSKSVILLILWDSLMLFHINLLRYIGVIIYLNRHIELHRSQYIINGIGYCLIYLSFPLFGLLADIKTGRYKTIITSVQFSFLSWIIGGLGIIGMTYFPVNDTLFLIVLGISFLLELIGICCFFSNIVQFSLDQAIGASADELSAIIYWHTVCLPLSYIIVEIGRYMIEQFLLVFYVLSGMTISLVLITNYLFKFWLDTTPHIVNPVKVIGQVLKYARKNKYPRNRSALTYWEEDYPSRLDLGKQKYGGPFSEEQVEDVKTVLRLIPLLISIVGFSDAIELAENIFPLQNKTSQFVLIYFVNNDSLIFLVALVLILLYQFLLYPCFYKFVPSMLKRIGLGLTIALLTTLYYVIMLACKDSFNLNITSYKAVIIPRIMSGIVYACIVPTSLEFTIAQCPHEMRGFLVGLWYAAFGLGYLVSFSGKYLFSCQRETLCQRFYFYVFKSVIILLILIIFLILSKSYKFRVRENEINIHRIAEEHHERYLEQEAQYRREMGLSLESTD